ncbi:MAG: ComF family protein [Clostridia bacterium]|nr:ComF family protein [Clostridia bacterium]
MKKNGLLNGILNAFFPPRCVFCDKVDYLYDGVCKECLEKVEKIEEPVCLKCGMNKKECRCKSETHYFDGICAPYSYEGVVRRGIHLYKFDKNRINAEPLARMIAACVRERFPDVRFDMAVSVPVTKSRLKEEGFDHGALLAQAVANELNLLYDKTVLKKIYETKSQHLLNRVLRRGNLAGVFEVTDSAKVEGRTVLICDDVSTTGETLDECSKMLYLAGAGMIYCCTLALTRFTENKQ